MDEPHRKFWDFLCGFLLKHKDGWRSLASVVYIRVLRKACSEIIMEKSDLHLIPMVYNHNVFVYNGIRGTLKTEQQ